MVMLLGDANPSDDTVLSYKFNFQLCNILLAALLHFCRLLHFQVVLTDAITQKNHFHCTSDHIHRNHSIQMVSVCVCVCISSSSRIANTPVLMLEKDLV